MGCNKKIICVGGGGHAASVLSVFKRLYPEGEAIILDSDPILAGKKILGFDIVGADDLASEYIQKGYKEFVIGIGMVKPSPVRAKLFDKMLALGGEPITLLDPSVNIGDMVDIDKGSVVLMGAIINAETKIGPNVIINSGAIIEHHCIVEAHSHIASGAVLCGNVKVKSGSFIGAGSVIVQQSIIAPESLILPSEYISLNKKK